MATHAKTRQNTANTANIAKQPGATATTTTIATTITATPVAAAVAAAAYPATFAALAAATVAAVAAAVAVAVVVLVPALVTSPATGGDALNRYVELGDGLCETLHLGAVVIVYSALLSASSRYPPPLLPRLSSSSDS